LAPRLSDSELVSGCLEGESWAWDALIDRYKRVIYSIPLRAGLTENDAADVFQTVFTRLFERLRSIKKPGGVGGWLVTTAKRESWAVLRKRRRELSQREKAASAQAQHWLLDTHPDENLWIEQSLVRDAVERVGGRCRALLWLLYYDPREPSYDEISHMMNVPSGSIGPTRARCLKKLRGILEAMNRGES
jgi:RNA polymerase sigma factor (sigma-70 family)